MNRAIPVLASAAALGLPAGQALAAGHATPAAKKASSKTYTGPAVEMRWGPVQVQVTVSGRKITKIKASYPMERMRSYIINSRADPILRQEVLQAQSASVDTISGATMTSEAYAQSLQAALDQAHFKAGSGSGKSSSGGSSI